MLISGEYRKQNTALHKKSSYGASGGRWAKIVKTLAEHYKTCDILDYGAGKGMLKKRLRGVSVREYDPAIKGKDALPESADIVVCTDVLEHVEPDCISDVLDHIQSLTRVISFFVIATREAGKTLPDGRNAHLIIQPSEWWRLKLTKRFKVCRWEAEPGELIAIAKPRRSK